MGYVMKLTLEHCNTEKNTLLWWLCITLLSLFNYNAIITIDKAVFFGLSWTQTQCSAVWSLGYKITLSHTHTDITLVGSVKNVNSDQIKQFSAVTEKERGCWDLLECFSSGSQERSPRVCACVCVSSRSCVLVKYIYDIKLDSGITLSVSRPSAVM